MFTHTHTHTQFFQTETVLAVSWLRDNLLSVQRIKCLGFHALLCSKLHTYVHFPEASSHCESVQNLEFGRLSVRRDASFFLSLSSLIQLRSQTKNEPSASVCLSGAVRLDEV